MIVSVLSMLLLSCSKIYLNAKDKPKPGQQSEKIDTSLRQWNNFLASKIDAISKNTQNADQCREVMEMFISDLLREIPYKLNPQEVECVFEIILSAALDQQHEGTIRIQHSQALLEGAQEAVRKCVSKDKNKLEELVFIFNHLMNYSSVERKLQDCLKPLKKPKSWFGIDCKIFEISEVVTDINSSNFSWVDIKYKLTLEQTKEVIWSIVKQEKNHGKFVSTLITDHLNELLEGDETEFLFEEAIPLMLNTPNYHKKRVESENFYQTLDPEIYKKGRRILAAAIAAVNIFIGKHYHSPQFEKAKQELQVIFDHLIPFLTETRMNRTLAKIYKDDESIQKFEAIMRNYKIRQHHN